MAFSGWLRFAFQACLKTRPRRPIATVFALGFHEPKPMHSLVFENWSKADFIDFVFISDHADEWRALVPPGARNLTVIQISLADYFQRSFEFFGVSNYDDFLERKSWLFHRDRFDLNGYNAPQLKPLLIEMFKPKIETKFWGWVDNDVLMNRKALLVHLSEQQTDLVLSPESGFQWEQFKLYSTKIDLVAEFRWLVDYHINAGPPMSPPLEAKLVYHLRDCKKFNYDGIEQARVAVHWGYTDAIANMPNHYDVSLDRYFGLSTSDSRSVLFFNADTQINQFDFEQTNHIRANLSASGSHLFRFDPKFRFAI